MDSFAEFSHSLNQKPENTRSSLIESQQIPLDRVYNTSGRPLNLSDFRNENHENNSSSYGPSDSWFPQMDETTSFPEGGFIPYDDSGRTFNLTEFQNSRANSSNSLQHPVYPSSIQHLKKSKSRRNGTQKADSRVNFHHVPCDFLKTHCHEYFQNSQCQQNECPTVVPRRLLEFDGVKNGGIEPKLLLKSDSKRNHSFELLVKDFYNPGIIVDSVSGLVNFNKITFNAVFDCDNIPMEIDEKSVPMSLLEAFSLRIQYEQDLRDDLENRRLFCSNFSKNGNTEATLTKRDTYRTHRDELKLASTIDIDLMTKVANIPETPLTKAINCLLKAEKMNNFDRNVHLAEEAIRSASDGQQELEALRSTCSFKLNLQKNETKTSSSSTNEPLAIISYIGTTKPNNE